MPFNNVQCACIRVTEIPKKWVKVSVWVNSSIFRIRSLTSIILDIITYCHKLLRCIQFIILNNWIWISSNYFLIMEYKFQLRISNWRWLWKVSVDQQKWKIFITVSAILFIVVMKNLKALIEIKKLKFGINNSTNCIQSSCVFPQVVVS